MEIQNIGLYIDDITVNPDVEGAATITGKRWKRSELCYNNQSVSRTNIETNNFGLYVIDNSLELNGEKLIESTGPYGLVIDEDVNFGNIPMTTTNKCIKISLQDYIQLRSGNNVDGYAKYNPYLVYYITNDTSDSPVYYDDIPDKEDIIYNSYTGELPENSLSNKTFTDPKNTPELAIRGFSAIVNPNQGLELEYFVDTRNYDSNKGIIGNTFTTIITDEYNRVIFKRTTYAGQFRIKTDSFKNRQGKALTSGTPTWIRIKCIDNEGRGSLEYFYNILIDNKEEDKNILTLSNKSLLNQFNISVFNEDTYDNATYEQGLKTRRGLHSLCQWAKNSGYQGIKLYNEKSTTGKNSVYVFDARSNCGDETKNEYIPCYNEYFIFRYEKNSTEYPSTGTIYIVTPTGEIDVTSEFYRGKTALASYTYDQFKQSLAKLNVPDCSIKKDRTYKIDGINRKVTLDPDTWVYQDGAHLFRDPDSGKVRVFWNDAGDNEVAAKGVTPYLAVRNLQQLFYHMSKKVSSDSTSSVKKMFFRESGYYYMSWYHGAGLTGFNYVHTQMGDGIYRLPNHFILDLNGTTISQPNDTMLNQFNHIFFLDGSVNIHIKNGKVQGSYTRDNIKEAFIKQCHTKQSVWESGEIISAGGSRFCSFDNLEISNLTGYGIFLGTALGRTSYNGGKYGNKAVNFKDEHFGYIGVNKQYTTNNYIIKENGKSIVPEQLKNVREYLEIIGGTYPHNPNYIFIKPTDNSDVCLVTSTDKIDLDEMKYTHYVNHRRGDPLPNNTYDVAGTKEIDNNYCNYVIYEGFAQWYPLGGVYQETFVNLYDANNQFIDTIKTIRGLPFKKLKNSSGVPARKCTMTVYGIGKTENGQFKLYEADYGSWSESKQLWTPNVDKAFLHWQNYRTNLPVEDFTMRDCHVHTTRSIVTGNPGINTKVINTKFSRICATDGAFSLTPMLLDWEEGGACYNTLTFENCDVVKTPQEKGYHMDQSVLGMGHARNVTIKNCQNIGINCPATGSYFADTKFTKCGLTHAGALFTNYRNIMKRCTLGATSPAELTYFETGSPAAITYILEGKHCWDPIPDNFDAEECFIVSRTTGTAAPTDPLKNPKYLNISGRFNKVTDSYEGTAAINATADMMQDKLNVQLAAIRSNSEQENTWVHCLVETTSLKEVLEIGTYAGSYIKKKYHNNNNKLTDAYPCYIDGTRHLTFSGDTSPDRVYIKIDGGSSRFVVPETYQPGYHIVSFLLNSTQVAGNHVLRLPSQVQYVIIPEVAESISIKEKFNKSALRIYSNCVIQCNCPESFNLKFYGYYPKLIRVNREDYDNFTEPWSTYINQMEVI